MRELTRNSVWKNIKDNEVQVFKLGLLFNLSDLLLNEKKRENCDQLLLTLC